MFLWQSSCGFQSAPGQGPRPPWSAGTQTLHVRRHGVWSGAGQLHSRWGLLSLQPLSRDRGHFRIPPPAIRIYVKCLKKHSHFLLGPISRKIFIQHLPKGRIFRFIYVFGNFIQITYLIKISFQLQCEGNLGTP